MLETTIHILIAIMVLSLTIACAMNPELVAHLIRS